MAKKRITKSAKKTVKKPAGAKAPLMPIDAMTPGQRQAVFRDVQAVLSTHGVTNRLLAMHLDTNIQPLVCQPPKVRRMVCSVVNGVPVCRPDCVDP